MKKEKTERGNEKTGIGNEKTEIGNEKTERKIEEDKDWEGKTHKKRKS
jgi:hypothetical protein